MRLESGRSPTRTAQSNPSLAMSTTRSDRFSDTLTSGCWAMKRGTSGATWRRPKPAGAVTRRWPLAFTPPALTLASALARSVSRRWQSSRNALPSCVRVMRRVVRTSNFTPRRSSRASMRRPITAGATPSARAVAVRLPLVATVTKDSSCLSLSMSADYVQSRHKCMSISFINARSGWQYSARPWWPNLVHPLNIRHSPRFGPSPASTTSSCCHEHHDQ